MSKRRDGLSKHTCRPASGVHHTAKIKNTASISPGVSHHYSIKQHFCHISIFHAAVPALTNNTGIPFPNTTHSWQQPNHLRCRLLQQSVWIPKETFNNVQRNDHGVRHSRRLKVSFCIHSQIILRNVRFSHRPASQNRHSIYSASCI